MTINIQARRIAIEGKNGSRKRRFSVDRTRAQWYAEWRQARFQRHFAGK